MSRISIAEIPLKKLRENAKLPKYAHDGYEDSGADVFAVIEDVPEEDFVLKDAYLKKTPKGTRIILRELGRCKIPLGFSAEIPEGLEIQVRPRSGNALNYGITVANTPGTVDAGYRGEISIILINMDTYSEFEINHHDKIAQIILAPVVYANYAWVDQLTDTERGAGGFGSTGEK
jgi:dUTP pyrophosphatase